jgi:hypothetical protein
VSSRIHDALAGLEHEVDGLRLASPAQIRARGESLRRRRAVGTAAAVAVGAAVTGAVAIPVLHASQRHAAQPPVAPSGVASASGCGPVTDSPHRPGTVTVFLATGVTDAQKLQIETRLRNLPGVVAVDFDSREQAWQRFRAQFCDAPDLVAATKPDALPESFIVTMRPPATRDTLVAAVGALPGVDAVVAPPT